MYIFSMHLLTRVVDYIDFFPLQISIKIICILKVGLHSSGTVLRIQNLPFISLTCVSYSYIKPKMGGSVLLILHMSAAVSAWSSGKPMAGVQEVYLGCCLWRKQREGAGADGGGGSL